MFESKVQKDVPQRTQAVGTALEQMDVPMKEYEDFGPGVDKVDRDIPSSSPTLSTRALSLMSGFEKGSPL